MLREEPSAQDPSSAAALPGSSTLSTGTGVPPVAGVPLESTSEEINLEFARYQQMRDEVRKTHSGKWRRSDITDITDIARSVS